MMRSIRLLVAGLVLLAVSSEQARAQYYYPYGYGNRGYGFGGWGQTPQGNIAQGLGAYARGQGVYNYDTAVANSINTNTVIRYNQYLYESMLESRKRYNREHARKLRLDDAHYNARLDQIKNHPTPEDIDSGDALNMILEQLSVPEMMNGSVLRLANGAIPAGAIKEIPFRDETDAITLSLDQLTETASWPVPLRSDVFKPEREAYQKAVDDALAEDSNGALTPETITRVRTSVAALYDKVARTIPTTKQPDHLDSMNYLKGLAGLSKMLEKPNVDSVLAELEKVKTTTVGNLISFMHAYNLRFAPATTPRQRSVYRDLYPLMVASRDKVVGQAGTPPPPSSESPTAIFHGLDGSILNPTKP